MAFTKEKLALYKQAVDKWGIDSQLDMVIEECAELILAIQYYRRNNKPETIENIKEEIGDLYLMLEQVRYILGIDMLSIYTIQKEKLKRLEKLLRG